MRRPVVFLGPTLAADEAAGVLPATYLPPAAQGSIVAAVQRHDPSAILIVDGMFERVPAVRHKEILWALSRGVPVVGAASMGALRAAELHRHGMVGVGLVYRWLRRFPLLPDDAVAVLQGPPELGSFALTRALVDVRRTVRRVQRAGLVDPDTCDRLLGAAAALNFRDRTLTRIVQQAVPRSDQRTEVRAALVSRYVAQKRQDALAALRLLSRPELIGQGPRRTPFVATTAFLRDLRDAGIDLS